MQKLLLILLLLLPTLLSAETTTQLPDASRSDWLPVQQTWHGGAGSRGSVTVQMILDLIAVGDVTGLQSYITDTLGIELNAKDDQTAAEIQTLLDAYYGGTAWRTGGVESDPISGAALSSHTSSHPAPTLRDSRNQVAGSYLTSEVDPAFSAWGYNYVNLINQPTTITAQQASDIATNNAKVSYPGAELTADQQAAVSGAALPSASNVFATMGDVASAGGGDITGVTAGTGLSGGGSVGDVTLNIANTAVTPGAYTSANITVDQQGRITAATSGTGSGTTDHAALTNLDYASAGHTGFATAAQGALAASALQAESDPVFSAWDKDYVDLINQPAIPVSGVDFDPVGTDNSTPVTGNEAAFNAWDKDASDDALLSDLQYTNAKTQCNAAGVTTLTTGTVALNSNALTVADASSFQSGQGIYVEGAGTEGQGTDLVCEKIVVNGTAITMFDADGSTPCNTTSAVSNAKVGHDDTGAFNYCVDTYKKIYIPDGEYNITSEITIDTNNVELIGSGVTGNATYTSGARLVARNAAANTINVRKSGAAIEGVNLKNFTIFADLEGARCVNPTYTDRDTCLAALSQWVYDHPATAGAGIVLGNSYAEYVNHTVIDTVEVWQTYAGLQNNSSLDVKITNSFFGGSKYGVYHHVIGPRGGNLYDNVHMNAYAGGPYTTGDTSDGIALFIDGSDADLFNNIQLSNSTVGLKIKAANPGGAHTVDSYYISGLTFTGLTIENCLYNATGVSEGAGILIEGPTAGSGIQIIGGHFGAYRGVDGGKYGVRIHGGANNVTFGNYNIDDVGTTAPYPHLVIDNASDIFINGTYINGPMLVKDASTVVVSGSKVNGDVTATGVNTNINIGQSNDITGANAFAPSVVTGATANGGLVASGTTLGIRTDCGVNQIPKWTGSTWSCADDSTQAGGAVGAGTAGQFAYYSTTGNDVAGRTLVAGDIPAIKSITDATTSFRVDNATSNAIFTTGGADSVKLANAFVTTEVENGYPGYGAIAYAGTSTTQAPFFYGQNYGGTKAAPVATADNQVLFQLAGRGYSGSAIDTGGVVAMKADGQWSPTSSPAKIIFRTTPAGSTGAGILDRMIISHDGQVSIPYLSGAGTRDVCATAAGTLATTGCPASSGTGDITQIGDCTTGDCFTPSGVGNGTALYFNDSGGTANYGSLSPVTTLTGFRAWTLPDTSGTLALTSGLASYLPLSGGALTGKLKTAAAGLEFSDATEPTDCTTFTATGAAIFFSNAEDKFKKCVNNVKSDLITGGASIGVLDTSAVVSDSGADGKFTLNIDGVEKLNFYKSDVGGGGYFINLPLTDADGYGGVSVQTASSTGWKSPFFLGLRSRGTAAAKLPVVTGDTMFTLAGQGWDGSIFKQSGAIKMMATENWGVSNHLSEIQLIPTSSAGVAVIAMKIQGTGVVNIGGLAGAGNAYACINAAGDLYRSATACN